MHPTLPQTNDRQPVFRRIARNGKIVLIRAETTRDRPREVSNFVVIFRPDEKNGGSNRDQPRCDDKEEAERHAADRRLGDVKGNHTAKNGEEDQK